jgi:hypothetical protein
LFDKGRVIKSVHVQASAIVVPKTLIRNYFSREGAAGVVAQYDEALCLVFNLLCELIDLALVSVAKSLLKNPARATMGQLPT